MLQGQTVPRPEGWVQEMHFALFQNGQEVLTTTVTGSFDDDIGVGFVVLEGVAAGTYDIFIRAPRSLANVKRDVVLSGIEDTVDMGTLLTGNGVQLVDIANSADIIDGTDFSILAASFFLGIADPGYDGRADYDGNNFVDGSDFSLLAGNFFISGPVEIP